MRAGLVIALTSSACTAGDGGATGFADPTTGGTDSVADSGVAATTTAATAWTSGPADDTGIAGSNDADTGAADDTGGPPPPADAVVVHLVPQAGVSGTQRINLAVPLWPGALSDADAVTVLVDDAEVASYRRGLASHRDGSVRSVQIQFDLDITGERDVTIGFGSAGPTIEPVAVADTLVVPDGTEGPRVWALLPASWLATSGVTGPTLPADEVQGAATAWADLCDYEAWGTDAFLADAAEAGPWLYDRPTAMFRGYARTGDRVPLAAGAREVAIYVAGSSGEGAAIAIPVPDASDDLKYHYAQGAAIQYLLSGDDRYREFAESIAVRAHDLWSDPGYDGGADFWTERHAGFALLAYVWAARVSDDHVAELDGWADEAVAAYLAVQDGFPPGYDDPDARCFAHEAEAHGEDYGYVGCSPWMSAILADALDAWITDRDDDADAITSLVRLGRILAREGSDAEGRPLYWMGVGVDGDEPDEYEEHWGESAYVIALASYHAGGDADLRAAADALIEGFAAHGEVGQVRSFNWQCRSAIATPWYLQ